MILTIELVNMAGGYRRAIIGQTFNKTLGEWCIDSVWGSTEQELVERLKIRFPQLRHATLNAIVSSRVAHS
jgi:hypothetical protein